MFELFRKYTKSDSALDQNKKHKDNLEHLVEDMNATQTSNEDEFEKIRQETSQLIIDVAKEQSEIDAKQNAEISKKATSQALVEEEKARDLADKAQVQEIGDLQEKTTALEHKMSSLEKKGSFKGTYATLAQAQAKWPNPLDGDYILVGTQSPYQEYIFGNGIWEQGGLATASAIDTTLLAQKDLSNIADATFLAKAIQALVASQHYVDERTISFATMENGKTYLTKQNQDGTKTYWEFNPETLHATITTETDTKLALKADKSYVDTQFATKQNKLNLVDGDNGEIHIRNGNLGLYKWVLKGKIWKNNKDGAVQSLTLTNDEIAWYQTQWLDQKDSVNKSEIVYDYNNYDNNYWTSNGAQNTGLLWNINTKTITIRGDSTSGAYVWTLRKVKDL